MNWGKPEFKNEFHFSSIFFVSYLTQADLRHSHVAHCIELGFSPLAIAERMGHEGINITFHYAHLYPSKQKALADKLNEDRENMDKDGIGEGE